MILIYANPLLASPNPIALDPSGILSRHPSRSRLARLKNPKSAQWAATELADIVNIYNFKVHSYCVLISRLTT